MIINLSNKFIKCVEVIKEIWSTLELEDKSNLSFKMSTNCYRLENVAFGISKLPSSANINNESPNHKNVRFQSFVVKNTCDDFFDKLLIQFRLSFCFPAWIKFFNVLHRLLYLDTLFYKLFRWINKVCTVITLK